jgi:hypothetical protein
MSRRRCRTLLALALSALALASPAAAIAQGGAGDEQYADPFGKLDKKKKASGNAPQTQSAPAQAQAQPQTTQGQSIQTVTSSQLPRTGLPAGLVAAAGFTLLGSGALLRRAAA